MEMLSIQAMPRSIEVPSYNRQLLEAREGNARPRHLRLPYVPLKKQKNMMAKQSNNKVIVVPAFNGMGRKIDAYA